MPPKPSWHAEAQALAATHLPTREIAERLGYSYAATYKALHPEMAAASYRKDQERPNRKAQKKAWERARTQARQAARIAATDVDPGIPGLIPVWHKKQIVDFARVDIADWESLRQYRFGFVAYAYAAAVIDGKQTYLHHLLLGPLPKGSGMHADHINRDELDNRRANLRVVTTQGNNHNRGGKYERCWWRQQQAAA